MKKMHIIIPIKVYKIDNKYYHSRTGFIDEMAKHFDLNLHVFIKEVSTIDEVKFVSCAKNMKFYNFFDSLNFWHFIRNIREYRRKLLSLPKEDIYFVNYPFKGLSIFLAWILRKRKLVIWVKSDTVAVLNSLSMMFSNGKLKGLQRFFLNPIKSLLYIMISRVIFKENLIFYTANIVINKKNHINQFEIISCPIFNSKPGIIKKEISHKICFIGGEANRKGLSILLKALSNKSLKEKIKLNIIGLDGFKKEKNKKLAKDLKIKFHGIIYERNKFYNTLSENDILVMPSFAEKQGKVQLEAMSAGVVPICSDSGGTYKTISNYYNGLLFKPGDYRQLCNKIKLLYENNNLYEDLKSNGLECVKKLSLNEQIDKMSKTINNFYEHKI